MREGSKRPVYYCRRLKPADAGFQDGMETFATPVLRYLNFRALNGETELETIGEVDNKHLIAKQSIGGDSYLENDRFYINKAPPDPFDPLCADADYKITSVLPHHRTEEIIFERLAANANV